MGMKANNLKRRLNVYVLTSGSGIKQRPLEQEMLSKQLLKELWVSGKRTAEHQRHPNPQIQVSG